MSAKKSASDKGLVRLDQYEMKRLRLSRGWTVEDFVRQTGMHKQTAGRIFGGVPVQVSVARAVAETFGVQNLLDIIDSSEYRRPAATGDQDDVDDRSGQWETVGRPISPVITTSNDLQYRIYKMRHRYDSERLGRGKRYELMHLPTDAQQRMRHCLVRHMKVCDAVGRHPQFPICYGSYPEDNGQDAWWVVDEWTEGQTLQELLEKGPLDGALLPSVMTQVAGGLKALHDAGIVRRELTPSGILLCGPEGHLILTDFELAKLSGSSPSVSTAFSRNGYHAPEIDAKQIDRRADIYSWGRILVHAATGQLPQPGCELDVLNDVDLPKSIVRLAERCLKRRPSERPDTVDVILRGLRRWR